MQAYWNGLIANRRSASSTTARLVQAPEHRQVVPTHMRTSSDSCAHSRRGSSSMASWFRSVGSDRAGLLADLARVMCGRALTRSIAGVPCRSQVPEVCPPQGGRAA